MKATLIEIPKNTLQLYFTLYNEINFSKTNKQILYGEILKLIELNSKGFPFIYGKLSKFMI